MDLSVYPFGCQEWPRGHNKSKGDCGPKLLGPGVTEPKKSEGDPWNLWEDHFSLLNHKSRLVLVCSFRKVRKKASTVFTQQLQIPACFGI